MQNMLKRIALILCAIMLVLPTFVTGAIADDVPSAALDGESLAKAKVTLLRTSGAYTGYCHHVPVQVTLTKSDGTTVTLREGSDYVVAGNETPYAKAKSYKLTIVVVGIGSYKGYVSKKLTYKITKATQSCSVELEDAEGAVVDKESMSYTIKYDDLKLANISLKVNVHMSSDTAVSVSSSNSKIKATNTGVITVKKGLKAGTYKVTFYGKSTSNYNISNKVVVYIYVVK